MKPILTRSEITDAVYIVTKYKVLKDGLVDTIEKYDVTNQFDAMTEPLRAENAKLRELVKQIETCAVYKGMCHICPMLEFEYGRPPICTSRIGELKRELGFEVQDERA